MTLGRFNFPGSSYLAAGSYDTETEELIIVFRDGAEWAYAGVPQGVVAGLQGASSAGKYFHERIKDKYPGVSQ